MLIKSNPSLRNCAWGEDDFGMLKKLSQNFAKMCFGQGAIL